MENMYAKVVTGNKYDREIAARHNFAMYKAKVKAKDIAKIESDFIQHNHVGCCLHYALALYNLLYEAGYEVYLVTTPEDDGDNHASVCYALNGKRYIADPVETVITGDFSYIRIPFEKFKNENAWLKVFEPNGMYGEELFFENFLANCHKEFYKSSRKD